MDPLTTKPLAFSVVPEINSEWLYVVMESKVVQCPQNVLRDDDGAFVVQATAVGTDSNQAHELHDATLHCFLGLVGDFCIIAGKRPSHDASDAGDGQQFAVSMSSCIADVVVAVVADFGCGCVCGMVRPNSWGWWVHVKRYG